MKEKTKKIGGDILLILVLIGFPAVVGGALAIATKNLVFMEVIFVIFGLVELLVGMTRIRRRDTKNYKKNKTVAEDKTTKDYKNFINSQILIFVCGALTLLASLIVFAFEGKSV